MLTDLLIFAISGIMSSAVLAAQHWFPWNRGARPLTRIQAYIAGTSVVVGVPVAVLLVAHVAGLQRSPLFWAALLVFNTAVSGSTVMLAYWIDGHRAIGHEDIHAQGRD